jgi:hypothetical protein
LEIIELIAENGKVEDAKDAKSWLMFRYNHLWLAMTADTARGRGQSPGLYHIYDLD